MTVSTTTEKNIYDGDGSTTSFSFTFNILDETNLLVQIKDDNGNITTQTLSTDYTVSGTGNRVGKTDYTSGNVNFVIAPASTEQVIIKRDTDLLQQTDYTQHGAFPAESNERALDKLTLIAQNLKELIGRSVKSDPASPSSFDFQLPSPEDNANKYLKVNSSGDGFTWDENTASVAGFTWEVISSDKTVESKDAVAVDTSGSVINITLPGSPTSGESVVRFLDYANNFGTNKLTVKRNGKLIENKPEDMDVTIDGASFALFFINNTKGWKLYE